MCVGISIQNNDREIRCEHHVHGSYRLYEGLSLFAYGLNLSNEVFGFYQGSEIYPNQQEYYHPTVAFGMRWNSSAE